MGGVQDLTGQPAGGPAYPSRIGASSSPPLCFLRGEKSGISTHEEESSPRPLPVPPVLPTPGPDLELSPPLTLRLVLAAYKAFVAFIFQQLE